MKHLQEKMAFLLDPSLYLLCLFALSQLRKKDITTDNGNTGQRGASVNSYWIDSLLLLQNAAVTSPIAAWNPGGRGTVFWSRSSSMTRPGRKV